MKKQTERWVEVLLGFYVKPALRERISKWRVGSVIICLTVVFLVQVLSSCKKELQLDNSDKQYAIQLNKDSIFRPTKFSWKPTNVSNFKSYILVRSSVPIAFGLNPEVDTNIVHTVAKISEQDSTTFTDYDTPASKILYYKLYVSLGTRFIESQNVADYLDVYLFTSKFTQVTIDQDTTWTYLYHSGTGELVVFDYALNRIIADKILENFTEGVRPQFCTAIENQKRILIISDDKKLYKFEMPSLKLIKSSDTNFQCFSLISNKNGLLISTNNSSAGSINVWRQADLIKIASISKNNYHQSRELILLDPGDNRILEVSQNEITAYNINQSSGNFYNSFSNYAFEGEVMDQIVVSPDRKYFIPFLEGFIFGSDIKLITNNTGKANDFAFSNDSKFVYKLMVDNFQKSSIKKLSFPELDLLNEVEFTTFNIKRIYQYDNSIVCFGMDLNSKKFIFKRIFII